jgi:DNA-binding NarL/FixJ family response regulator
MSKIKIILVDDHRIVRDGIKSLLNSSGVVDVIAEAESYNELERTLKDYTPDIIIMDISLPDLSGIEITKIITANYPFIKVIILSMYINEDFILNSIKAGAKGYLPKNTTKSELIEAIRTVNNNDEYFNKEISSIILKSFVKNIKYQDDNQQYSTKPISNREEEILKLVSKGCSNKEISEKLFISIRTVESHKNHIMKKLNLKTNIELIKYSIKNNLIDI